MSAPQSIIYICSGVRLDNRYEHSIYFENATAQQEYFAGKVVKTFPAYSYLRKSWPLQVEATMEQAKTWSYLYFRNGSGKIYYYFINQVEYKNDNMVELTLELDVLQTYFFDFGLLDCFVERQHTETDVMGEHTLDEGLETGELMDLASKDWTDLESLCILALATINPNYTNTEEPVDGLGYLYDNVFSGLTVWAVSAGRWADLTTKLEELSGAGFLDGIVSMWMYPKSLVTLGGENTWEDDTLFKVVKGSNQTSSGMVYVDGYTRPDGLQVNNRKLYCYPYNFLYATNNQGTASVYRFERFEDPSTPIFSCKGSVSPDASVKMYPRNYNGQEQNYDQGMAMGGYPTCAWDADVYKLWLAQNQNQNQHAMGTAGLAIAGGAVTAMASLAMGNVAGAVGGAGAVIGGAQQIGALMAQKADMAIQPPQSRGSFSSTVNVSAGKQTFTLVHKCVSPEYATILDNYFTMYGYKLNRVRKPNLKARPAFTYIKTVGCNLSSRSGTGAPFFCTEDRVKITSIFDHGITFWVDGDKIADYTQYNRV